MLFHMLLKVPEHLGLPERLADALLMNLSMQDLWKYVPNLS